MTRRMLEAAVRVALRKHGILGQKCERIAESVVGHIDLALELEEAMGAFSAPGEQPQSAQRTAAALEEQADLPLTNVTTNYCRNPVLESEQDARMHSPHNEQTPYSTGKDRTAEEPLDFPLVDVRIEPSRNLHRTHAPAAPPAAMSMGKQGAPHGEEEESEQEKRSPEAGHPAGQDGEDVHPVTVEEMSAYLHASSPETLYVEIQTTAGKLQLPLLRNIVCDVQARTVRLSYRYNKAPEEQDIAEVFSCDAFPPDVQAALKRIEGIARNLYSVRGKPQAEPAPVRVIPEGRLFDPNYAVSVNVDIDRKS